MCHRGTGPVDGIVAIVFVGVTMRAFTGKAFDMVTQGHLFGIGRHTQPDLTRLAANCADHWRTVIGEGATSASLIGASSWGIERVEVFNPFFPPHSETFRRFQNEYLQWACRVAGFRHWLAPDVAI